MIRSCVFVICLVSALAINSVECSEFGSKIEVNFVQNLTDFLNANPGIELKPLVKKVSYDDKSLSSHITYVFGRRIVGDRLLETSDGGSQQWSTPQDVVLNLYYPKYGFAEIITHLEVNTVQSSNVGRAYIISGDIGQRRISIIVEAKQTLYWQYRASIFGY